MLASASRRGEREEQVSEKKVDGACTANAFKRMLHKIVGRRQLTAERWNVEPPDEGGVEVHASGVILIKDDSDRSKWKEVWAEARQDEGLVFMPCPSAPRSWGIDLFDLDAISTDGVNFLTKQEVAQFSSGDYDDEEEDVPVEAPASFKVQDGGTNSGTQKFQSTKTLKSKLFAAGSQMSMGFGETDQGTGEGEGATGGTGAGTAQDHHDENLSLRKFYIRSTTIGFHRGKIYTIVCPSEDIKDQWLEGLAETLTQACDKYPDGLEVSAFELFRSNLRETYASRMIQSLTAMMIVLNFTFEIVMSQRHKPVPDAYEEWVAGLVEATFTGVFTLELIFNMMAHMWTLFINDPWNWFDVLVMSVSLASLVELSGGASIPGITVLRLLRGLRIVRLFNRLKSLRNIIQALYKSIPAMLNAFSIVCVIMSIYAIMAVDFFSDVAPDPIEGVTESYNAQEYFGNWSAAMFTLFQILTGDGWTDIVRPLFYSSTLDTNGVGAFFVSYIIIVSMILVQVVIALLLNEFDNIKANDPTDLLREQAIHSRLTPHRSRSPFNPLFKEILKFSDVDDLMFRVQRAYSRATFTNMDDAKQARVAYDIFRRGLLRINVFPAVRITVQDWDKLVVKGGYASEADGKIDYHGFLRFVMKGMHELQVGHVAHASSKVGGLGREQVDEVLKSLKFLMAKEHINSALGAVQPPSPFDIRPHPVSPDTIPKYLGEAWDLASINGEGWNHAKGERLAPSDGRGAVGVAPARIPSDEALAELSGAVQQQQQQQQAQQQQQQHVVPQTPRQPPPDDDWAARHEGDARVASGVETGRRPSTPIKSMEVDEDMIELAASKLDDKLVDIVGLIQDLASEVRSVRGSVEGIDERLGKLESSVGTIGSRIGMQQAAATVVSGSEGAKQQPPVAGNGDNAEWWSDLKGLGDRLSQVGNLRGGLQQSSFQKPRDASKELSDGSSGHSSLRENAGVSPVEPRTSLSARKPRLAKHT